MRAVNRRTQAELAGRVGVAASLASRLRGLVGRQALLPGEGLLIPARGGLAQIHTLFMRFAIDVVYLDGGGRVLRADAWMPPWRIGPLVRGCRSVLELPAGAIGEGSVKAGDVIELVEEESR